MNAPDHLHGIIGETVAIENEAAHRRDHWAVILGLAPVQDGDHFGFIWGDLPTGVAAFGKTPREALYNFDVAMDQAAIVPPNRGHAQRKLSEEGGP